MTPFEHLKAKLKHAQSIDADVVRVDIEELVSVLDEYESVRAEAVDELAYWVAEKMYSVTMDFEQRAEFIALMEIKVNEMKKEQKECSEYLSI